jgi:hypothetical protein
LLTRRARFLGWWRRDDNEDRPHSSLGTFSLREFVAPRRFGQAAGGEILNRKLTAPEGNRAIRQPEKPSKINDPVHVQ